MRNPELVTEIEHRIKLHKDIARFIRTEVENHAIRGIDVVYEGPKYPVEEWIVELGLDIERLVETLDWADREELQERLHHERAVRGARMLSVLGGYSWNGDVGTLSSEVS